MKNSVRPTSLRAIVGNLPPQSVATFAIRIAAIGAEFACVLLLARLLGVEAYGRFAFAMSLVAIAVVPAMFGFDRLLIRDVAAAQAASAWEAMKGLLVRAVQVTVLASLVIVCVLTLVARRYQAVDAEMAVAFAFAAALVPVIAFVRLQQAALQGLGHVPVGLAAESLIQPLMLAALLLTLVASGQLQPRSTTALALQVCASGTALVVASLLLRRRLPAPVASAKERFRDREWLPAGAVFMWLVGMSAALVNVDTLLVGALLGPAEAGAYRVASQLAMFVGFPLAAVSIAMAPAIAALYSQGRHEELDQRVRHASRVIFAVAVAVAVCAAMVGRPLLAALGPGFDRAYPATLILVAAYLFHAAMATSTYLLFMTAHERLAAIIFTAGAASHVALGLILIPRYGIAGAAMAAGSSLALVSAASALMAWKKTGMNATIFTPMHRIAHLLRQGWLSLSMRSSRDYWERRYRLGMTSGPGSTGELAHFKAEVLNGFVREHGVQTVIEFGCGDGTQLALAQYPRYLGIDVSPAAIELCRKRFSGDASKSFRLQQGHPVLGQAELADLTLSLDVIYHLLEDDVYAKYLADLFGASHHWVIVYSSNREEPVRARHVRHRPFVDDVRRLHPGFELVRKIDNPFPADSFADFYVFRRVPPVAASRE